MITTDKEIARFENFLVQLQSKPKGETTERLIKWVKDSICDMKEKKVARQLSEDWEIKSKL
jgi:hypothetical protein